jgi:hypothetical protein
MPSDEAPHNLPGNARAQDHERQHHSRIAGTHTAPQPQPASYQGLYGGTGQVREESCGAELALDPQPDGGSERIRVWLESRSSVHEEPSENLDIGLT